MWFAIVRSHLAPIRCNGVFLVMNITLLEKLDDSCSGISLQESVCRQVQRIISTRIYVRDDDPANSYITGFGLPEIVELYTDDSSARQAYRDLIREKLLALEPRLTDVQVIAVSSAASTASCRLKLQLGQHTIEERFFF